MSKKLSESLQPERLRRVRNEDITLTTKALKELKALKNKIPDLSDPDLPEITNWDNAVVGKFYRPIKKQVTLRLDADILEWFKIHAEKYQSLINEACREYVLRHQK